jgi:hypothetical protein
MNLGMRVLTNERFIYIKQFCFGCCDTLLATLDEDLVWFELLADLALTAVRRLSRECDLDRIFFLEADDISTVLTNQRRMVLVRDLQGLGSLVGLRCEQRK